MLTKNAKKILLYGVMNSSETETNTPTPSATTTLINTSGVESTTGTDSTFTNAFTNALNHMSTTESITGTTYIKCGTGTTAATEDDYNLEVEAIGLTCDSAITAVGSNNTKTYTATFSNATETDITVTEIGFFCYIYHGNGYENVLLDRILLETPITIPAGESKPITYEIGF